ncbi:isocitrate lyase/phosphoenolpyruvate mutase family protein [Streptomyces sp. AJS327]|uniref:isocitrate lyase/PEP mutase family protein n=1 Tax=Streptomyces sp. AJS327 TaxID=2545265 RepID=UPI0015E0141B|nr:isocitrate lyase/phosphoenolpyruvate mutase family protein [Streptomyces sp. AJS327]MBA0053031.1 isocitrate lyase/phosphoenolpyruvate mutase family protein [Streptomyces sp. AJS327]
MTNPLNVRAQRLRSLHDPGQLLTLPNVWDALSAVVAERAGAPALGTTSSGVAWSLGYPDGQRLSREDMIAAIARVTRVVDVPVTADIEGGYGPGPRDVATTVTATVEAGAVGVNLEDSPGGSGPLHTPEEQAERIAAAREAAGAAGLPELVINARTDVYLARVGEPAERFENALARARAYAEAGADCLFVPLLFDLAELAKLVDAAPLPISAMAMPGAPDVAAFREAGVRRISVGGSFAQAAYATLEQATREFLTDGTYHSCESHLSMADLQGWFRTSP